MNKLFKPRCLRRIFLCLALMFPIVYLCGGLFFGLAGAHGEQLFSQVEGNYSFNNVVSFLDNTWASYENGNVFTSTGRYLTEPIEVDSDVSSYKFEIDRVETPNSYIRIFFYSDTSYISYLDSATGANSIDFVIGQNITNFRLGVAYFTYSPVGTLTSFYPSSLPYISAINYSDYLFSQPFATNNFITTLGKDLINGSNKGFAPMNSLFNYVNSNVFHFDVSDNLAMFGFGYVYYVVNVLIVYEILVLAVKLIMLPLKAVDVFDKEDI